MTVHLEKKYCLQNLSVLKSIKIGDECFGPVQTFKIDGLNRLKTIKIGNNSFTQIKRLYYDWWPFIEFAERPHQSNSFHILNCESLESIQIGEYGFSDFGGDFELKNLPQLQSIHIGTLWNESCIFSESSFVF